jgi:hypothetical protein
MNGITELDIEQFQNFLLLYVKFLKSFDNLNDSTYLFTNLKIATLESGLTK